MYILCSNWTDALFVLSIILSIILIYGGKNWISKMIINQLSTIPANVGFPYYVPMTKKCTLLFPLRIWRLPVAVDATIFRANHSTTSHIKRLLDDIIMTFALSRHDVQTSLQCNAWKWKCLSECISLRRVSCVIISSGLFSVFHNNI